MNNFLRGVLIFLLLVAAFFLLGVLFWLFYCNCCQRLRHVPPGKHGEMSSAPLNKATAEPERPRGKYPPFQVPKDWEYNKDHPRIVPTGPQRGTLAPSVQGSKLLQIQKGKPAGGAGDPVVVTQYNPQGTSASVGTPPDPNAARNGNVVMLSYKRFFPQARPRTLLATCSTTVCVAIRSSAMRHKSTALCGSCNFAAPAREDVSPALTKCASLRPARRMS